MTRDYEWLDAAVVLFALGIVAFIAAVLSFRIVPENQLAILASIASGILGTVVGAYAGYRWATSKQASETIANLASKSADPQPVEVVNTPDQAVPVKAD
nr:hypothetical protein [uncultured Brevundimonas sp.]